MAGQRRAPMAIVMESTLPLMRDAAHGEWEPGLLARGYQFAMFDGLNRYYVAHEHVGLLPAFSCGPNVFDNFTLNGTANSPFCAVLNARIQAPEERQRQLSAELHASEQVIAAIRRVPAPDGTFLSNSGIRRTFS